MDSASSELNNWYESLKCQALCKNEQSVAIWSKYKDDLELTKSLLISIPKKVRHKVMVPIGPKALMRGNIVHTNEFLVNLGETWFAKRTAHQTIEICDRRIKTCDGMLEKLKTERELIVNKSTLPAQQEAFGNEERPEIVEYVTEEENEEWKNQHRIREKKYHQQLAELRSKEKKPIETEEDLWKHLDELELQEELEDELNRLNAKSSSEEDVSEKKSQVSLPENKSKETQNGFIFNEQKPEKKNYSSGLKANRTVSFFHSNDDSLGGEPLRLEIKHSSQEPVPSNSNSGEINSPDDIYNYYLKLKNKMPLSVLKNRENFNLSNNLRVIQYDEAENDNEEEELENDTLSRGACLNDIFERDISGISHTFKINSKKTKKISKFKASRKKCE